MATDLEQMNVTMNARFDQFSRQLARANADYQKMANGILAKRADLAKKIGAPLPGKFFGLDKIGAGIAGLTAVGIGAGIADLIGKSLDAGKALEETSRAAGVGIEKLQALRFASSQTGGSFAVMDEALTTFNKTFGEFLNTGAGKGANAFKNLGIDKMINSGQIRSTEQAWDTFLAKIRALPNEAQRISYAGNVMGKEIGPKMAGFIDAGAQAITDLENKARSLGIVMSEETARSATEAKKKLDALFDVMKSQGVNALAQLSPQIIDLADQITASLPNLLLYTERWADWFGLIKMSPVDKLRVQIADLNNEISSMESDRDQKTGIKGFLNRISTGGLDRQIALKKTEIADLKKEINKASQLDYAPGGKPAKLTPDMLAPGGMFGPPIPALHTGSTSGERDAAAKAAEALAQKRKEMMDKIGVDQATADAALVADQNKLTVQLLTGQVGYYDAVQKMIIDDMNAKLAVIDAEEKKQIDSLGKQGTAWKGYADAVAQANAIADAKRGSLQADVNSETDDKLGGAFDRDAETQANRQIQAYKDQIANLGLVEGALAAAAYYQEEYNKQIDAGVPAADINTAKLKEHAAAVGAAAQAESDAAKISERSIQMQDELRTGLEDVGVAGLHGFKSMKDAAAQFLEQLAEMILKLYVMKPLIENLLGSQGGSGGGLIGDFLGSLFGGSSGGLDIGNPFLGGAYAKGGVFVPGRGDMPLRRFAAGGISNNAAIFGEAGAEAAVPLPDGRRIPVALRLPSARQMGRGGNMTVNSAVNIDARGAQIGVAEQLRAAAPMIVGASVKAMRDEFAQNMAKHLQSTF